MFPVDPPIPSSVSIISDSEVASLTPSAAPRAVRLTMVDEEEGSSSLQSSAESDEQYADALVYAAHTEVPNRLGQAVSAQAQTTDPLEEKRQVPLAANPPSRQVSGATQPAQAKRNVSASAQPRSRPPVQPKPKKSKTPKKSRQAAAKPRVATTSQVQEVGPSPGARSQLPSQGTLSSSMRAEFLARQAAAKWSAQPVGRIFPLGTSETTPVPKQRAMPKM